MKTIMLDSGAFTSWTKGVKIDLEEYISFCESFPDIDYYVNLDVISGSPDQKHTPTRDEVEACCIEGWSNYRRMIDRLPKHKVIPVFHKQDDVKWLDRFLNFGCIYLGIGGLATSRQGRETYLTSLRRSLFKNGKPIVKLHGFALTSHDLMNMWQWHSVDSSTWQRMATWGQIWIPRKSQGAYDFGKSPTRVAVTPSSGYRGQWQHHAASMSPLILEMVKEYLSHLKIPMGSYEELTVPEGYKLDKSREETWKLKGSVIYSRLSKGVATSYGKRFLANALTMRGVNAAVSVKNLYLAGPHIRPNTERGCVDHRLLSYLHVKDRRDVLEELVASKRKKRCG